MTGCQIHKPVRIILNPGCIQTGHRRFGMTTGIWRSVLKNPNIVGTQITAHGTEICPTAEQFAHNVNTAFHSQQIHSCTRFFMNPQMFPVSTYPHTSRSIRIIAVQIAEPLAQLVHSRINNRQMQRRNPFNRFRRFGQIPSRFQIPVCICLPNQIIFISTDIQLISRQFKLGVADRLFHIDDFNLLTCRVSPNRIYIQSDVPCGRTGNSQQIGYCTVCL